MNDSQHSKTAVIKTLAIVGFFATLVLGIWLIVQGLRWAPNAFSSLASLAESMQNYGKEEELSVAAEKSIVVTEESFRLSWTDLERDGTYEFSFPCTEGVRVSVRNDEGNPVEIPCTDALSLPSNAHGLFMSIASEKARFIDVPFTLTFKRENGDVVTETNGSVTVVNATIPLVAGATETTDTDAKPAPVKETPKPAAPKPVAVAPKPTTPVYTTYYPVSDPTGFTDLKVSFVSIGTLNGSTFKTAAAFDRSERNAFRFEVMNIGTKTSGVWSFKTVLPGDLTFESEPQIALKPNEKVEFTVGFEINEDDKDTSFITKTTVTEKTDLVKNNNALTWNVKIVK